MKNEEEAKKEAEYLRENRDYRLKGFIVRTMKTRKEIEYKTLVNEVEKEF